MKVFIIDISGKVINYDIALCEAITQSNNSDITLEFYCPLYDEKPQCKTVKLINLVPRKYKNGEYLWKRILKLIELILNYIILIGHVAIKRPDVIHLQWLPLLEVSSGEHFAIKLMRLFSKRSKIVLTMHNLFPHAISEIKKNKYTSRFNKISKQLDAYIVHTEKTKEEAIAEFSIKQEQVYVIHHGIFVPKGYKTSSNSIDRKELSFIVYGNLTDYKGVDIFVEAIKHLPKTYHEKIHGVIAGEMQNKKLFYAMRHANSMKYMIEGILLGINVPLGLWVHSKIR